MRLLAAPFDPGGRAPRAGPLAPGLGAATAAAAVVALGWVGEARGALPPGIGGGVGSGAVHAGLLALGWIVATDGRPGWAGPAVRLGALLLAASVASRLHPGGALGYLLVPALLLLESRPVPALAATGLGAAPGARPLGLALAAGAFLGLHLLATASLTLGYAVRVDDPARYAAALAYDAGANVLSAEWCFRGGLFCRWWRRAGFWPAAAAATAVAVLRYLADPTLPRTLEVSAGAVFYTAALGLGACALRAWSGSLVPGYLFALCFFAAYRTLAQ